MTAQYKSVKDAVYVQAAGEVENKELKRKAAIKGKGQTISETLENQSELTSPAASEPKNKDEDLPSDGDSSRSTQLDNNAMTIGRDGDEGLNLTSEQKSLCELYTGDT